MKKLMIAAAVVCAAAVVQAASIDWGIPNLAWKNAAGNNPATGSVVYLINGDTALDTIAAAVKAGTVASQSWFYGSAATDNTKGRVTELTLDGGSKLTAGTSYNFSALLIDGDKYMVSKAFAQTAYTPGVDEAMAVSFDSSYFGVNALTYNASTAANGWAATAATPEPTSAMLILLGFAGLALKRKRA